MAEYTEGVCGDGAAILRDGVPVAISDVLAALNQGEQLRSALTRVAVVEREIRFTAYTSAGAPALSGETRMYAIWAGTLQAALAVAQPCPAPK